MKLNSCSFVSVYRVNGGTDLPIFFYIRFYGKKLEKFPEKLENSRKTY